jgi:alkylglycerol monooxygenase
MGPNLIALAIPLFLSGIALELFLGRKRPQPLYALEDSISSMGCGITQQLVSTLFSSAVVAGAYQGLSQYKLMTLPVWLDWTLAVVGVEFAYYWWHRLSHEVNVLWAAHVVHHQSTRYNLSTALRQSVATWLTSLPFYLPLALLGVTFIPFAVVLSLSTLYQFWIHTELIGHLGVLEWIFNTPAQHRVHHAINPRFIDKNHSATFSVFDRLFGTFQREDEPCRYGTTAPMQSISPLWAQVDTVATLFKQARTAPSFVAGLRFLFASPAMQPPWMPSKRDQTPPPAPALASKIRRRYCLLQWLVALALVFVFLMWGNRFDTVARAFTAGIIVLSLTTLPALLSQRPWAIYLERLRVVGFPVAVWLIVAGWH